MSQYFPPQQPPSNPPPPPPGFGPVPPQGPYGAPQAMYGPTRTSAAAVTSLICGVLGCLGITALVAIITGIIGIRATGNPQVKGRGMAIAGLLLGIVFGLGGAACLSFGGLGLMMANREINEAAGVVDQAFAAAAANDDAAFQACWAPTAVVPNDFVANVQKWGKPTKFEWTYNGVQFNAVNGVNTCVVRGTVTFPNGGPQNWHAEAIKTGASGGYKLEELYPE